MMPRNTVTSTMSSNRGIPGSALFAPYRLLRQKKIPCLRKNTRTSPCKKPAMNISIHNIDTLAILITVLGYLVVFVALALLVFVFVRIKRIQDFFVLKKWRKAKGTEISEVPANPETTGDENAAICTALYLFFN